MPSNLQELFGLIAFFGFAALVIHSLWQASKRVPPATDRLPAGVDGALLIVAGLAFLAGIYDAAAAALAYQYVGAGDAFAAQCALNAFGAALFFLCVDSTLFRTKTARASRGRALDCGRRAAPRSHWRALSCRDGRSRLDRLVFTPMHGICLGDMGDSSQ